MEEKPIENVPVEPVSEPSPAQEPSRSGVLRFLVDIVETLLLSVLLFLSINAISARIRVDGYSMEPTLQSGEFVLVNKLAYRLGKPKLGDVIVFHPPQDPSQEYIKRVIGLPGDHVTVLNGQVSVNGQELNEPYIAEAPKYHANWEVPADSLFVLGDNRNNSSDSHNWGPVPMGNIIGKALVIYWPPRDWAFIYHPAPAQAQP